MAAERSAVPAITRAMRIIELLAEAGQAGASVADIAATTGIAKSSAALICGVLEEEKLAGRSDGRYRLGPRFLTLARDYLSTVDRLDEASVVAHDHGSPPLAHHGVGRGLAAVQD